MHIIVHWLVSKVCTDIHQHNYRSCFVLFLIVMTSFDIQQIVQRCLEKKFQGKITDQTSDKRFILQSDQFQEILVDTNAIK